MAVSFHFSRTGFEFLTLLLRGIYNLAVVLLGQEVKHLNCCFTWPWSTPKSVAGNESILRSTGMPLRTNPIYY